MDILLNLEQFVPSEVCLQCDGCCRFKEQESVWRPKMSEEEIQSGIKSGLAELILRKNMDGESGYIKTVCSQGKHRCSHFEFKTNTCGIYSARPFECQLYPFVLTRRDQQAVVCVHRPCPFIQQEFQTEKFVRYVVYLKNFFLSSAVTDFLARNPSLIGEYKEYQDELEYLFSLIF